MSKKLTKFVRVAVAGQTATDGRTIEPKWLTEMAANYNPETFTARVNVEHYRNASATGPFPALGDVKALKVQTDDIEIAGKTEKRLALYAQIEGNETFQAYIAADQKKFSSIEVDDNFSGTGTAYLVGFAASDNPASLGTEAITFSTRTDDAFAKQLKAELDGRKQRPTNCFSSAYATSFQFEDVAASEPGALDKLVEMFSGLIKKDDAKKDEAKTEVKPAPAAGSQDFAAVMQAFTAALAADRKTDQAAADKKFAALEKSVSDIKTALESEPSRGYTARRPANGGDGRVKADC